MLDGQGRTFGLPAVASKPRFGYYSMARDEDGIRICPTRGGYRSRKAFKLARQLGVSAHRSGRNRKQRLPHFAAEGCALDGQRTFEPEGGIAKVSGKLRF
jgi:hypothetical protein